MTASNIPSALPRTYHWLPKEPGPAMLVLALQFYGVIEAPGAKNNPVILAWAKEVGLDRIYTADEIPWCGLFMALLAQRTGRPFPEKPLWALNWAKWGADAGQPELGDVLVFIREGGGHVGLYVGEDAKSYHVLGANQANKVCIIRIEKIRLRAARRPIWQTAEPPNRRPIILSPVGEISENEA